MRPRVEPLIRTKADEDRLMWEYLHFIQGILFGIAAGCLMLATSLEPGLAQTSGVCLFCGLVVRWIKRRFRPVRYAQPPATADPRASRAKVETV